MTSPLLALRDSLQEQADLWDKTRFEPNITGTHGARFLKTRADDFRGIIDAIDLILTA